MRTLARFVVIFAFAGISASSAVPADQSSAGVPQDPSALGYLNLHKRHPDGAEGRQEFDSYTAGDALKRLEQMQSFLESFRKLTDQARTRIDQKQLEAVGNTSGAMQTIGFHNIPLVVEGTLLKQQYQLAQARYELAQLKFERKQIVIEELNSMRSAYRDATARLQSFWDMKLPTD